jgi:molybdenum-dependent DNA-binding transcriptional regulator ModE
VSARREQLEQLPAFETVDCSNVRRENGKAAVTRRGAPLLQLYILKSNAAKFTDAIP